MLFHVLLVPGAKNMYLCVYSVCLHAQRNMLRPICSPFGLFDYQMFLFHFSFSSSLTADTSTFLPEQRKDETTEIRLTT